MSFACEAPRPYRKTSLWVGALLVGTLSLSGCGLRLDTPPDALPSLDPGQAGISAATRASAAISAGADAIANDASQSEALRAVAGNVRDQAEQRLSAMGGVWDPWPSGTPQDAEPGPTPATVPGNLNDLLQLLVDSGATSCRAAGAAPEANEATLLAAVCAASSLDASRLAGAGGVQVPQETVSGEQGVNPNPEGSLTPITDKKVLQTLQNAEAALDFARFRSETAAAFLTGDDRKLALERAQILSWEVQRLIELGAEDVRAGQYALDFETLKDKSSAVRLLNSADADALAAELDVVAALPPAGKDQPERREFWISAVRASAFSQSRFAVPSATIFSQLWP